MLIHIRAKAFTLIELLIAVTIIAILAALVVQNYTSSRIRAFDTNVKSSVAVYQQAMTVYYAQYKSYFVFDHSKGCTPSIQDSEGYTLQGSGTGCVGLNGGSEGMMTRRHNEDKLKNYQSQSIADALVANGALNRIEPFPGVSDFTSYSTVEVKDASYPADFVLTLCNDIGKEAENEKSAVNFAIYAAVKRPNGTETGKASQLCGSSGTGYGWHTLWVTGLEEE